MAYEKLTSEQLEETARAFEASGRNYAETGRVLGLARATVQHRVAQAGKYGLLGTSRMVPGFEIAEITEGPNGTSVKQRQSGPTVEIPDGMLLTHASILSRDGQEVIRWDKYATERHLSDAALAEAVRGAFADYVPTHTAAPDTNTDTFTVYPLVDFHVGLLAWENETGENYDTNIAERVIVGAMRALVDATPPSRKAVILGLGDLLHFDGYEARTDRSGNVLDTDSRYPKILRTALRIVKTIIEMALERHAEVEVRILQGNHDDRAALAVALALSEGYDSHPRVLVDDGPSRIWYYRYGAVFLCASHGDKIKMPDMPLIMAVDRPHDWAASTRRRIYTGHIHHERVREIGGVVVESMRSPVAKDAYHTFQGYRAGRSVYSHTYWTDGSRMATMSFDI